MDKNAMKFNESVSNYVKIDLLFNLLCLVNHSINGNTSEIVSCNKNFNIYHMHNITNKIEILLIELDKTQQIVLIFIVNS